MGRLIEKDKQGNWHLKDLTWERIYNVFTREEFMLIHAALYKLLHYEETGLEPWEISDQAGGILGKMEDMQELQQYRQIGTLEECREARERQHPRKVSVGATNKTSWWSCGSCCSRVASYHKYCPFCGQAIDWGSAYDK